MTAGPAGIKSECPICGKTMNALSECEEPETVGINQLRTHIRSTAGAGHGSSGQIPEKVSRALLVDHVKVSTVAIA